MTCGSASRASELLQVTQPAVSRSIAALERAVQFALFDRVKGRLVPTPEGKLFFQNVSTSFVGLDNLRSAAAQIRDFGSGSIRIASLAAMGSTLVPRAIRAFRVKHSTIAITLEVLSSSLVRDLVASQQFDLGIAGDEVDLSGVDNRNFASFRAVCAVPSKHRLACRSSLGPKDLHNVQFIALAPEDRTRKRIEVIFEEAGTRPEIVVETPNSATICALALEGVGVGLVNPAAAEGYIKRGLLFKPFEPAVYFVSYLLFRPDAQKARLVKDLVRELLRARSGVASISGS
jgi:DNA-binding transcriptional LysR family regulator